MLEPILDFVSSRPLLPLLHGIAKSLRPFRMESKQFVQPRVNCFHSLPRYSSGNGCTEMPYGCISGSARLRLSVSSNVLNHSFFWNWSAHTPWLTEIALAPSLRVSPMIGIVHTGRRGAELRHCWSYGVSCVRAQAHSVTLVVRPLTQRTEFAKAIIAEDPAPNGVTSS